MPSSGHGIACALDGDKLLKHERHTSLRLPLAFPQLLQNIAALQHASSLMLAAVKQLVQPLVAELAPHFFNDGRPVAQHAAKTSSSKGNAV